MRDAAAGVIGDAGAAGVEVFVFMSVLLEKYVPKAARRHLPLGTHFDHDIAPNILWNSFGQQFPLILNEVHGHKMRTFKVVVPEYPHLARTCSRPIGVIATVNLSA